MGEIQELIVRMLHAFENLAYAAVDVLTKKYSDQFTTNCMGFVSLTILLWDHIATFSDEVEYVWKGTNGPIKYLFLLNRYLILLGFSVNIFAYLSPALSNGVPGSASAERCAKFVRFEGSMTVIGINIVAIMMFYRVYALYWGPWSYSRRRYVYILAAVLLLEIGMNAWLLTQGVPADSLGCEMIFRDELPKAVASSSAWLPLLYVIGGLNLSRQFWEDGLLYYGPILVVTLTLSLMIAFSPRGSRNIMAQLELIITVTMMSRISINLKKAYHEKKDIDTELAGMSSPVNAIVGHARAQITSVLDITRSGNANEPGDDLEMVTRSRDFDFSSSSTDIDIVGINYGA